MNTSVAFEKFADNLQEVCPLILGTPYLNNKEFERFFKNILNKEPHLSLFLNIIINNLDTRFKEVHSFIMNNLEKKHHNSAIISGNHTLIIGKNEPDMSKEEILCSAIACIAEYLPEIQQEECAYFIPKHLRDSFRESLHAIKTPSKLDIETKYKFPETDKNSSKDPSSFKKTRIAAVAVDASMATKNTIETSKQKLFRRVPITTGSVTSGYPKRIAEAIMSGSPEKCKPEKTCKPKETSTFDLTKYF